MFLFLNLSALAHFKNLFILLSSYVLKRGVALFFRISANYICRSFCVPAFNTYPNRVTRPLEEAVIEPSSSMVYSAEMLSCRKSPSGSFFCSAYHFPEYCGNSLKKQLSEHVLHRPKQCVLLHWTHSFGVEVFFD